MAEGATTATYLFCLARPGLDAAKLEGAGIDTRSPLRLEPWRDIVAVVSAAPLADFTGEGAAARLQDVEWLAPRALRHEQVIEQVARCSPVLPARFGTLFASRESLIRLLARHHDAIVQFLDRVADKEEWAVKGYLDRKQAADALAKTTSATSRGERGGSPGADYIKAQRARAQSDTTLKRWLQETSDAAWKELMLHAADFAERRVLPSASDEIQGDMVLNWAFLVSTAQVDRFRARVQQISRDHADKGLVLRVSGAWPPFSFTPALADSDA